MRRRAKARRIQPIFNRNRNKNTILIFTRLVRLNYEIRSSRSDSTIKQDPTAANRSSIRRHRTVRQPPTWSGSRSGNTRRGRNVHVHSRSPLSQWVERFTHGFDRESSDEPQATGSSGTSRDPSSQEDDSRLDWPPLNTASSTLRRRELSGRLMRDAFRQSFASSDRTRPGRGSSLRFELPSPPPLTWMNNNDRSRESPSANETNSSRQPERASLTPGFAPAYPVSTPIISRSEDAASNTPLLRRVGHRSINDVRGSAVPRSSAIDGLGDRERSFSPGDDNEEHDAWETLLTTIRPDDNLPSTDSSFASANASSSNGLAGTSANSSQTGLSTLSSDGPRLHLGLDPFPDFIPHCDMSSSDGSDTEAESDTELGAYALGSNGLRRLLEQEQGPSRERRDNNDSPTISFSQDGSIEDPYQLQPLIDHLARREDIPDEWWAAIGLTRRLGRSVSSRNTEDRPREHL